MLNLLEDFLTNLGQKVYESGISILGDRRIENVVMFNDAFYTSYFFEKNREIGAIESLDSIDWCKPMEFEKIDNIVMNDW